jgi:hypothetical protein
MQRQRINFNNPALLFYLGGYVMLKRIIYLFVLYFFIFINSVTAAEPEQHLVILYNSDTKGYIEGCG